MKMKLSDVCEINPKSEVLSDETTVSFVSMSDVSENGKINVDTYRPYCDVKKGFSCFKDGDVLFAKITPCMENGKGALAKGLKNGMGFGSTEFHVLRPRHEIADGKWVYYLTAWSMFRKEAEKNMTGSAGQKRVPKSFLEKYELTLPALKVQQRQVQTLDRIKRVIEIRQQQLQALDDLVKARFVEMFGDEKNILTLSDVCSIITDGTHQPPKFTTEGIPFLFVSNITGNKITYDAEKFINQETYDELIKRTPIEIGDVLLSTVGSYGHPAVVKEERKFLFQRHIAYIKPKKELIDSDYLHGAILSPDVQNQIEEGVKGVAQKTLNLSEIKKMRIPVPVIDKQTEFTSFVAQVDSVKDSVQKALDKTQMLLDSLMQEYFG